MPALDLILPAPGLILQGVNGPWLVLSAFHEEAEHLPGEAPDLGRSGPVFLRLCSKLHAHERTPLCYPD